MSQTDTSCGGEQHERDYRVFAQHNKLGTFPVPKLFLNCAKEAAERAAAEATELAGKLEAKEAASEAVQKVVAEHVENKQTTERKAVKAIAQAIPSEHAVPVKSAKVAAAVQNLTRPRPWQYALPHWAACIA